MHLHLQVIVVSRGDSVEFVHGGIRYSIYPTPKCYPTAISSRGVVTFTSGYSPYILVENMSKIWGWNVVSKSANRTMVSSCCSSCSSSSSSCSSSCSTSICAPKPAPGCCRKEPVQVNKYGFGGVRVLDATRSFIDTCGIHVVNPCNLHLGASDCCTLDGCVEVPAQLCGLLTQVASDLSNDSADPTVLNLNQYGNNVILDDDQVSDDRYLQVDGCSLLNECVQFKLKSYYNGSVILDVDPQYSFNGPTTEAGTEYLITLSQGDEVTLEWKKASSCGTSCCDECAGSFTVVAFSSGTADGSTPVFTVPVPV